MPPKSYGGTIVFCTRDIAPEFRKWAKIFAAMHLLRQLALVGLAAGISVWAQSTPPPQASGSSTSQQTQPSQLAPDSDKKTPAEQAPATSAVPSPGDSTKLEPIKIEKAVYPIQAEEKQLQGQVWVKILVSETGDVEEAEVISGNPILADAAVHAVKKWKFKPFIKNGKPVKVSTKVPIDFAFADNVRQTKVPADGGASPGGEPVKRVRVSSGVTSGLLVYRVQPIYPVDARRAHIQGMVVLQANISKEGRITNLQLISGPKELADAAIGAVQQWRYKPYLLMGEPVEVDTQIIVKFDLH